MSWAAEGPESGVEMGLLFRGLGVLGFWGFGFRWV